MRNQILIFTTIIIICTIAKSNKKIKTNNKCSNIEKQCPDEIEYVK